MISEKTAVFIGHDECYGVTKESIISAANSLIALGVTNFLNGGCGGFDHLCAISIYQLKKEYPHINNLLIIPYLTFKAANQELFDEIIFPDGFERYRYNAAIPARNRYMVDNSSYAVCYITHTWGGAAKTYERAKKKKLKIINLGI